MTIVVLQCECETTLVLAVNTKTKKLMAYCPNCRKMYDILNVNIDEEELARVEQSVRELPAKRTKDALFYMRCTGLLSSDEA